MAQHEATPTPETIEAERKAKRWYDMNGTVLPEWGRYRKPSIMAAPESAQISLNHGLALAGILPETKDAA